jgi:pimeloyl-ACP methyl ester carboxylesterase
MSRSAPRTVLRAALLTALLVCVTAVVTGARSGSPAIVSTYPVPHPRGLIATTGGWAYCRQLQLLARRANYTLVCGRYVQDGYTGYGLRQLRHLDWGNPRYLAAYAGEIARLHAHIHGSLILMGVSYSGFGVAALAAHHPELHPDRLIVVDSYLDLVSRRRALPDGAATAREIDGETNGSALALTRRSASAASLAQLVRSGTLLTVVWSVSPAEQREFRGATCGLDASAATLARVATELGRPVVAWVTQAKHGHNLWDHGREILAGHPPGRRIMFGPDGRVPAGAICH